MESSDYKRHQQRTDVFRRSELGDTLRHLGEAIPHVARELNELLQKQPIEKPQFYSGTAASDLFFVSLSPADVRALCDQLALVEAEAVSPRGETTALASEVGALLDRWSRYVAG